MVSDYFVHMFYPSFSWLEMEIDDLASEEMCLQYIQLLREIVWPGGKYESPRRRIKSDKQKLATKTQAHRCLADFFPGIYASFLINTCRDEYICLFVHFEVVPLSVCPSMSS